MFSKAMRRPIWPQNRPNSGSRTFPRVSIRFGAPSFAQLARAGADCIILNAALVLAFLLRLLWAMMYEQDPLEVLNPQMLAEEYLGMYLSAFWVITSVVMVIFWLSGFYDPARSYPIRLKAMMVAEAVTFALVIVGMVAFVAGDGMDLPRSVLIMAWAISLVLFVASRVWSAIWRRIVQHEGPSADATGDRQEVAARGLRVDATRPQKSVLVIGGAGYIGSALLPKLLAEGYRVRVLDLFLYGTNPIASVLNHPELEIVRADFRRVDALVAGMQGVDHLVHLGGIVGDPACAIDEDLTIDVNLAATRLIGEVAKGNGIKHFVFASTCSVYGAAEEILTENSALNPLSLYARSKAASEKLLLEMADDRFTPIIVRFGTIHGLSGRTRFDLVVNLLSAKAAFEGRIPVFGGDQWRPFLHVDDAALAVVQLLCLPPGRGAEIFNIGSNAENYTIAQVGQIIKRIVPEAELVVESVGHDRRDYRVSFTKVHGMIGFKPHWTVEDGVRQVVTAIRAGEISDYREAHYSNERYLNEINGNGLDRPQVQWAYDLIRESCPPTSAGAAVGVMPVVAVRPRHVGRA